MYTNIYLVTGCWHCFGADFAQAEEKSRLAARKLSSLFSREVPFCACQRQDRTISVAGAPARLELCHEQVRDLTETKYLPINSTVVVFGY